MTSQSVQKFGIRLGTSIAILKSFPNLIDCCNLIKKTVFSESLLIWIYRYVFRGVDFRNGSVLQGQTPVFPRIFGHEAGGYVNFYMPKLFQ